MSDVLELLDLGRRRYLDVLELQRDLCRRRMSRELDHDVLLLVEHEPVVTLGRGLRSTSLPIAPAALERRGIPVVEVERGGDVTYHGPGQLVGYPILDLREHREDLHWYLRQLEGALMLALEELGVTAQRNPGLTGVWTSGRKIASLGIHVKQWVTLHGFALNVTTDLSYFDLIVPCGIQGVVMTSVARELGRSDDGAVWDDTQERSRGGFRLTFGYQPWSRTCESGRPHSDSPTALLVVLRALRGFVEWPVMLSRRTGGGFNTKARRTRRTAKNDVSTLTRVPPIATAFRPARSSPGSGRSCTTAPYRMSISPGGDSMSADSSTARCR